MCISKSWFRKLRLFVVRAAISTVPARQLPRCKFAYVSAIALLAVISAVVGSNHCFAQTSEGLTPQAQKSSADVGLADQEMISEINEIRKNLGGGLSQEFGEINDSLERNSEALFSILGKATPEVTDPTMSDEVLFGQELTSLVMGQAVNEPIENPDSDQSGEARSTSVLLRPADHAVSQSAQYALTQPTQPSQQQVLRRVARGLEQLAGELEQIEAYENADNLRNEADELWKKARTAR